MDYIRDINAFNNALSLSEDLLNKFYLKQLHTLPLIARDKQLNLSDIRLIKLYDTSSTYLNILEKLIPSLKVLHYLNGCIAYIVQRTHLRMDIYLAIKSTSDMDTIIALLQNTCQKSHFMIKELDLVKSQQILTQSIFSLSKIESITSLTLNPHILNHEQTDYSQLFKTLLKYMYPEHFTLLFLAQTAHPNRINDTISELESLSNLLDSFKETSFTYHKTLSDSCTDTLSDTQFKSLSHTDNQKQSKDIIKRTTNRTLDSMLANIKINDNLNYIINNQPSKETECKDVCSTFDNVTDNDTHTFTDVKTNTQTSSKGNNSTYSFSGINKTAQEKIKQTNTLLSELYSLQYESTFDLGIYFLAPHAYTTLRAAFTYFELCKKVNPTLKQHYIHTWNQNENKFHTILSYLTHLTHPQFIKQRYEATITPSAWINSQSLAKMISSPVSYYSKNNINIKQDW